MSKHDKQILYEPSHEQAINDWITFGGLTFPKYLVTKPSFEKRKVKYKDVLNSIKVDLANGVPGGDAGDSHGQFHNELAWRREQDIRGRAFMAEDLKLSLDRAVIVNDFRKIRNDIVCLGVDPTEVCTLTSEVEVLFGGNPNDLRLVTIVPQMDSGMQTGWISTDSELANVLAGQIFANKRGITFSFRSNKVTARLIS